MKKLLKCPDCGELNSQVRLYCKRCGVGLNEVTSKQGRRGRKLQSPKASRRDKRGGVSRLIRNLILIALIGLLGLMLWPTRPLGPMGSEQLGNAGLAKIDELYQAIEQGQRRVAEFTDQELNAYFEMRLAPPEGEDEVVSTAFVVQQLNVAFTGSRFIAHIAARWMFIPVTYQVAGTIEESAGNVDLVPDLVKVGHLPLQGVVGAYKLSRMQTLLNAFDREKIVFDQLERAEIRHGVLRVMVSGE